MIPTGNQGLRAGLDDQGGRFGSAISVKTHISAGLADKAAHVNPRALNGSRGGETVFDAVKKSLPRG